MPKKSKPASSAPAPDFVEAFAAIREKLGCTDEKLGQIIAFALVRDRRIAAFFSTTRDGAKQFRDIARHMRDCPCCSLALHLIMSSVYEVRLENKKKAKTKPSPRKQSVPTKKAQ
ncbi:MAG TPA: hypothetical protein VMX18_03885 [Candidatus Bipolaricaulota bacterium]|nr:hypothetical protein [Candidatus Bipolaricaulota bacterium]